MSHNFTSCRRYPYPQQIGRHVIADHSWGNDTCDSLIVKTGDFGLCWLWIESPDAAEREMPDEPRFRLVRPVRMTFDADDLCDQLSCGSSIVVIECEEEKIIVATLDALADV